MHNRDHDNRVIDHAIDEARGKLQQLAKLKGAGASDTGRPDSGKSCAWRNRATTRSTVRSAYTGDTSAMYSAMAPS